MSRGRKRKVWQAHYMGMAKTSDRLTWEWLGRSFFPGGGKSYRRTRTRSVLVPQSALLTCNGRGRTNILLLLFRSEFLLLFFLSVVCSPSEIFFGFPTKLSSLMRCESVPKTLTAKSNRGIYICGAGGAKGLREGPSKGCTKLKLN